MRINTSRQQVLQAYAKARQATYRRLSIVAMLLFGLAMIQLPCMTLLQQTSLPFSGVVNTLMHHVFQPFSWHPLSGWYPLQVIVYYGAVSLVLESVYIPVAFHIEYTLPRRFKLGTRTARTTLVSIIHKQGTLV
ncbi:MAG: hypothetical protein H0W02_10315, partial [Ktedonobacteraceae bacterium]|nr:hypothetical protein [Ktedonobacteraceae bacterium]